MEVHKKKGPKSVRMSGSKQVKTRWIISRHGTKSGTTQEKINDARKWKIKLKISNEAKNKKLTI